MDEVYSPNADAAPEPAPVQLEPLPEPAQFEEITSERRSDDALVRQSLVELRKQRERDGGIDDNPPVTEVRASRPDGYYRDLREPNAELSEAHLKNWGRNVLQRSRDLLNNPAPVTDDEGRFVAEKMHEAGVQHGMPQKPSELPWNPVGLVDDRGNVIEKLADDQPVSEADALNVRKATRFLGNQRETKARLESEYLASLQQQGAEQEQTNPEPAPTPTPQPAVDPLAQDRLALAQRQQALADREIALNMTQEQRALVARDQRVERWLNSVPEARSWEAWNYTRQTNPARAAQIIKGFEQCRNEKAAIGKRVGELRIINHAYVADRQARQGAARAQLNEAYDTEVQRRLAAEMPELSNDRLREEHQQACHEELRSRGMSDAQIRHEWENGQLRTPEAQMLVARAAKLRMMEQRSTPQRLAARRRNGPQPQSPGVHRLDLRACARTHEFPDRSRG
jgi:hypothetical protein